MTAGRYCNREVVITDKDTTIAEAATLMRRFRVGDLVVTENERMMNMPIGIVTDRDLVLEVLAEDVPLDAVTLKDVMNPEPVTVDQDESLLDTLAVMRDRGVRRLLVVNKEGGLEGIFCADDAIELLAEALGDLADLVGREKRNEQRARP